MSGKILPFPQSIILERNVRKAEVHLANMEEWLGADPDSQDLRERMRAATADDAVRWALESLKEARLALTSYTSASGVSLQGHHL